MYSRVLPDTRSYGSIHSSLFYNEVDHTVETLHWLVALFLFVGSDEHAAEEQVAVESVSSSQDHWMQLQWEAHPYHRSFHQFEEEVAAGERERTYSKLDYHN